MRPDGPRPIPFRVPINRRRIVVIATIAVVIVLLSSIRAIAGAYTDFLWFDQLGFASVWRGVVGAKVSLGLLFTLLFFVGSWVSLAVANRLAPKSLSFMPGEEVLERIHEVLGARNALGRTIVSAFLALVAGPSMVGQWNDWVLFRHAQTVGIKDPQFQRDIGFYLFKLPFLSAAVAWTFTALIIITLVTGAAHFFNGGIRVQPGSIRVTNAVKAHLSVLLALVALAKAGGYWLNRFELTLSTNGYVQGAGYTDLKARLPALTLLTAISLASVVLFVVNIRMRGWTLPTIAVGLWLLVSIAVGAIYPRALQAIVKSSQFDKEQPYIERNIEATRAAFGLQNVKVVEQPYDDSGSVDTAKATADLNKSTETVSNIRLWEPTAAIAGGTFTKLQQVAGYYRFRDVDVDRYTIDGKVKPVIVSVRELDPDFNEITSWVKRRLNFTHGYGVAMAAANQATEEGQPEFLVQNLPPEGAFKFTQPRVYFGEHFDSYAIGGTKALEVDFTDKNGVDQTFSYDGDGGVQVKSIFRKAAFALRFADPNLLISNQVTASSRILYVRNVRERAQMAAPFLKYDADPYPVVIDGRIVWVLDAYTTSTRYPYAQQTTGLGLLGADSGLSTSFNYVRNSVKVVVDAYTGATRFFVVDEKDPIAKVYRNAFPKLFEPSSQVDKLYPGLRAHFRYPEDIFRVQSSIYAQYHVSTARQLFNKNDRWDISKDPGSVVAGDNANTGGQAARMPAYYLLAQLPGSDKQRFSVQQSLVPFSQNDSQQNLRAIMVGESDPDRYGQINAYVFPRDKQIFGPSIAADRMSAFQEVSVKESQLGLRGSAVRYGNLQVLMVGNSLLYVRPMFVENKDSNLPLLTYVVVLFHGRIGFKPTLAEALKQALESNAATVDGLGTTTTPPDTGSTPTTTKGTTPTVVAATGPLSSADLAKLSTPEVLIRANAAYDAAQAALAARKLDVYQAKVDEMGQLVTEAVKRGAGAAVTTTTRAVVPTSKVVDAPPPSSVVAPSASATTTTATTVP